MTRTRGASLRSRLPISAGRSAFLGGRSRIALLLGTLAAVGGYFGEDSGRMSTQQPFPSGWTGAVVGATLGLGAYLFASLVGAFRKRRRDA